MSSVNKVILVGHIGQDPELRYTASGEAAVNLSLATSESWKDKQTGEKREVTEWHRVAIFGKPAEIAGKYLAKGSLVCVEGKIKSNKYTDKNGIERVAFQIQCENFKMLGSGNAKQTDKPKQTKQEVSSMDMNDDIPF